MKEHICKRCGTCCRGLGKSFWVHSDHPLIKAMTERVGDDFYDDTGACDMLTISESGRATCLLQKWLGREAKPAACRDYPFDGEKCFGEIENIRRRKR